MNVGFHIPFSGNLKKLQSRIDISRGNSFQIYARGRRALDKENQITKLQKLREPDLTNLKNHLKIKKVENYVVHAPYTYNLCKKEFDYKVVLEDIAFAKKIEATYYVLQSGYWKGMDEKKAIENLKEKLKRIIDESTWEGSLLIKNLAGAGTEVGKSLEDIGELMKISPKIGFALDIARAYLFGYDFSTEKTASKFLNDIEENIGIEKLKVIYANDTQRNLGERKNVFVPLGRGRIGWNGAKEILNHPEMKKKVVVVENQPDVFSMDLTIDFLLNVVN